MDDRMHAGASTDSHRSAEWPDAVVWDPGKIHRNTCVTKH